MWDENRLRLLKYAYTKGNIYGIMTFPLTFSFSVDFDRIFAEFFLVNRAVNNAGYCQFLCGG